MTNFNELTKSAKYTCTAYTATMFSEKISDILVITWTAIVRF